MKCGSLSDFIIGADIVIPLTLTLSRLGNGMKLSNRVIASSEAIFVLLEIASSSDSSQ